MIWAQLRLCVWFCWTHDITGSVCGAEVYLQVTEWVQTDSRVSVLLFRLSQLFVGCVDVWSHIVQFQFQFPCWSFRNISFSSSDSVCVNL